MSDSPGALAAELEAIREISGVLEPFDEIQRARILGYVGAIVRVSGVAATPSPELSESTQAPALPQISIDTKRFFASKRPATDIERVLVLATSIAQSGEPHFDSNRLVLELRNAAARKFNVIEAAKSAVKKGYFAPAGGGKRQVTLLGEEVADALPDRDAVNAILRSAGHRGAPSRT